MTSFNAGDPRQHRYVAYGRASFPDVRDSELDSYLETLRTGGSAAVQKALGETSEQGRRVLTAYAERAATRAVRQQSESLLVSALVALVVGGLEQNALEALMPMALIEDAGCRIGSQPSSYFGYAADIVGHPGSVSLMTWLTRKPEDRTPQSMLYEAGKDESGFRYIWKG